MLSLGVPLAEMVKKNEDLTQIPGIGEDLARKIHEIVKTGTTQTLVKLERRLPPTITELLEIPGLGPKRVKTLYERLKIRSLAELSEAARAGKLRELPGFGEKTEAAILEALETHAQAPKRFELAVAAQYAESLAAYLRSTPGVKRVVIAGSYRRCKQTVGDIDILVTAADSRPVMERFVNGEEVRDVLALGDTRATVMLKCGLQVDLRVVDETCFGAALHYFTGAKAHNIAIRRLGQQRRLKINEYGVFKGAQRVAGDTEESVFAAVGLPWIPPELRENRGEIEAAAAGRLPRLVELADLKGDLHAHTKATDGHHTLAEMAEAARARGFEYLAITEHSRRLVVAQGLDPERLRRQIAEIDRLNERLDGIRLLKGIEVDILEDGRLDLPDSVLKELDLVVGAVHSRFDLPRKKQTARILRAMDSPYFTILAHPSGRLIGEREAYEVDMLEIIRHARQRGCYLELNAHPDRLDLLDIYCRMAKDEGVRIAISSDAHRIQDFENLKYGVGQARRGWLEKDDVLNTLPLKKLLDALEHKI